MKQILPFIALSAIAVLSVFSCQKEPANTTPAPPTPSLVDLGLSVKWATCNLGASKPTEYGGYYQWAGTKDVSDTGIYLDWSNCPYHTGSDNQSGWTKYNTESSYGTVDNKTVLESMDDVASVVLGGKLRIPTDEEWMELRNTDNCSWTWTTIDGVNGYKVQSKKSGYTNNWIFLPAAGYRSYDRLVIVGSYGFYWSSSLGTEGTFNACSMYLSSSLVFRGHRYRCFGQSVRPVCKKEPAQSGPTSFEVPELVHVYGGHPFALPIVTEPASADISGLEFTHPEKTNFEVKIEGNQAILTYVPLAENDETEGWKVRSETLRIGNEALGYKNVVVHVSSAPITVAFLNPFNAAVISDDAVLNVDGQQQADGSYSFGIIAAVNRSDIDGHSLDLTEEEFSCTVDAPADKLFSNEGTISGSLHALALNYTKGVAGEMEIAYKFTDSYTVADLEFANEYRLSLSIVSEMEYVDLGLSVKWATCNLGASKPTENGGYYQWAGTKDVSDTGIYLDWSNCPYHTGSDNLSGWTKYNTESSLGTVDNKTVLEAMDDAASVVLGGKWRMPTYEEWSELCNTDNCSWTWTSIDGVNGYKVQSKKSGYTDKWIFLPAAGYRSYNEHRLVGSNGFYWFSSLSTDFPAYAHYMSFGSGHFRSYDGYRYDGQSVRPVSE